MVYEAETHEEILARCLSRVPDDIDKSEGSIIYDALAPACAELSQMYIEIDNSLEQTFANTASGDFLSKRCAEFGINRRSATNATRRGVFTGVIPNIGDRFGLNELTYIVTDVSGGIGNVQLRCEQAGAVGNRDSGTILPLQVVDGLTSAALTDILIPGQDTETDEALYARFAAAIPEAIFQGNAAQYRQWALSVSGVGAVRVIPVWDGANTVKVVIVDADKKEATQTLIDDVQDYIDPNQNGDGEGQAPIGSIVTVVTASVVDIDVSATLTLANGYDLPTVKADFEVALDEYLKSLALAGSSVRYVQVGNLILEVDGVVDYADFTLNGGTGNVALTNTEIAERGTVTFTT